MCDSADFCNTVKTALHDLLFLVNTLISLSCDVHRQFVIILECVYVCLSCSMQKYWDPNLHLLYIVHILNMYVHTVHTVIACVVYHLSSQMFSQI